MLTILRASFPQYLKITGIVNKPIKLAKVYKLHITFLPNWYIHYPVMTTVLPIT